MERLVEQPTGNGDLFAGSVRIGHVHYHLSVYQQFSDVENEPVPAHLKVEGRIEPLDGLDVVGLHGRGSEFTLRMPDGRALDFSLSDDAGRIRSTGRGIYQE